MIKVIQKLNQLLNAREKRQIYWLIFGVIFVAFFDVIGVVSIFPFLQVVSDPQIIETNEKLNWLYQLLGFSNKEDFTVFLGISTFILLFVGNVSRVLVMFFTTRITNKQHFDIAIRLLKQYLYEPYVIFLNRNSAELTNYLMAEVGRVVGYVLMPLINLFSKIIFVFFIFVVLLYINLSVTLIVSLTVGGGYGLLYFLTRKIISHNGIQIKSNSQMLYRILNEAFGGIKEVKFFGKEGLYLSRFSSSADKMIFSYCVQDAVTNIPKYAFELLAFGGIFLVMIYNIITGSDYQKLVPMIGLFAFAAYRLMPALQQIYQSLSYMRFGEPVLNSVFKEVAECVEYKEKDDSEHETVLTFKDKIYFDRMAFKYPFSSKHVIEDFDLTIKHNTTVAFVGGTGAGKTTIIDLLLGLLQPSSGRILVDGVALNENNLRAWQHNIGYVSQHIYLLDDTVTRNIAFSVPDDEIDQDAVWRAAKLANIHDFIEQKLSHQYDTKVGERGMRLSGGERQRIGIARALYHNPSLLVFDEATSALDGITEKNIIDAIYDLSHQKTIVIIAHRLASVKQCDVIYLLDQGKIVDQGTYDYLMKNNVQFQRMANNVHHK